MGKYPFKHGRFTWLKYPFKHGASQRRREKRKAEDSEGKLEICTKRRVGNVNQSIPSSTTHRKTSKTIVWMLHFAAKNSAFSDRDWSKYPLNAGAEKLGK